MDKMPFDLDTERAIIGACLIDATAIDKVTDRLVEEDFYDPSHSALFRSIVHLNDNHVPVDMITVSDYAKKHFPSLNFDMIADIACSVSSTSNVEYYAHIVEDLARQREIINGASRILEMQFGQNVPANELLEQAREYLDIDVAIGDGSDTVKPTQEVLYEVMAAPQPLRLCTTNMPSFDKRIKLSPGRFMITTGIPNIGKTSFLINLASLAAKQDQKVLFFSIEMPAIDVLRRLASIRSGTSLDIIESDLSTMSFLSSEKNILWDFSDELTLETICAKAKRIKPSIIMIDNVSLLSHDPREEEKTFANRVGRKLKLLANKLNCCVILIAHMNKAGYGGDKPSLKDIYGSVFLGANADVAMSLRCEDDKSKVTLDITKNRGGYCSSLNLHYEENKVTFSEEFGS